MSKEKNQAILATADIVFDKLKETLSSFDPKAEDAHNQLLAVAETLEILCRIYQNEA